MSRRGDDMGSGGRGRGRGPPGRGDGVAEEPEDLGHQDSEPEDGEDLYGETYARDYAAQESDEEAASDGELDDFIASDGSEVELDEDQEFRARAEVDAMFEQRRHERREREARLEREAMEEEEASEGTDDSEELDGFGGTAPPRVVRHRKRPRPDDEEAGEDDDQPRAFLFQGAELPTGGAAQKYAVDDDIYLDEATSNSAFNWSHPQGTLQEWLAQELPRRVTKNRIFNFLSTYMRTDDELGGTGGTPPEGAGRYIYREAIHDMVQNNSQSFEVNYWDLAAVYGSTLAVWLADAPELVFGLLDEAANYFVHRILYPHYHRVHRTIRVRLTGLPVCDPIRDFRQVHMGVLVRVEGVVIRRSPIYPQLQSVKFDCLACGYIIGPLTQRGDRELKVQQCPSCQGRGPFRINMALTEIRNYQSLAIQEPPGKVPPGRLPRSLEVILTDDLIDKAKPGDEVEVTGVYRNSFDPVLNTKQGFPVFTTTLMANHVARRGGDRDAPGRLLPDADRQRLLTLARHPNIKRKLLQSVAPSIHGREDIKLGLLLSLLGGVPKDVGGDQSHRIRGDINVLLVGDPGCAKSQFLKFVEMTADRAVFTTGRGSTAVGLTASVHKDPITGDFTLEGGALVIADRGVCLIDEFDKMSDQDRTSIHEAMEQQTISIARGGIVTTLSARCSIIAAANPIGGRYDPSVPFDANVNLTTPILSRFDLLFVVRDEINAESDERLASFICQSHYRNHPATRAEAAAETARRQTELTEQRAAYQAAVSAGDEAAKDEALEAIAQLQESAREEGGQVEDLDPSSPNPLPQAVLRQYIQYARSQCTPRFININEHSLTRVYTELRQESKLGGIPITVRHMESLIRLAEAHARLYLRDYARDEDVTAAIAFFLRCFLATQKYSARTALTARFRRYLEADQEPLYLLHFKLRAHVMQSRRVSQQMGVPAVTVTVSMEELYGLATETGISRDAVAAYLVSPAFSDMFRLRRDNNGDPIEVTHTLLE